MAIEIRRSRDACCVAALLRTAVILSALAPLGCSLHRTQTVPDRRLEPILATPAPPPAALPTVTVRLLDTQSRGPIGLPLLHKEASGDLVEDPVWRWTSAPARYLDAALRLALTSSPDVGLVESASVPSLSATLTAWHIDSTDGTRLVGVVELQLVGKDHFVHVEVFGKSEPITGDLPGDLAAASGRLLGHLARETTQRVIASNRLAPGR